MVSINMTNINSFPLHESVFHDNSDQLLTLLRSQSHDIGEKDVHGNSPLHLSVILGHKDCMELLLDHGAPVQSKNLHGWNPLQEAISYGDRNTISLLLQKKKQQSRDLLDLQRPKLLDHFKKICDFSMEMYSEFQSWVPFVSSTLPSDTCRIYKKGAHLRLDSNLLNLSEMKWQKGDFTVLFDGTAQPERALVFMDNTAKLYQRLPSKTETLEKEIDSLMSSDLVAVNFSTKPITFNHSQSGWFFKVDRREYVGIFLADLYDVNRVVIETRKRREHLSDEDIRRNKTAEERETQDLPRSQSRPSLPPPPKSEITWMDYINADIGRGLFLLGRPQITSVKRKTFKATVAMSNPFPIEVTDLLNILEVLSSVKHFDKLGQFLQIKLPPGFPVRIDVPILPPITAQVTFKPFEFDTNRSSAFFSIPPDYRESMIICDDV